jgi:hypothetical protein
MTIGADRFVATADIKLAIRGHETDILDSLGIDWRDGRPHIRCPYPDHADNNPSWRWEAGRARAFCTCKRSATIFHVLMKVEDINFEDAKIRAAELLGRTDLIRERRAKKEGADVIPSKQRCNLATPAGCTLAAYAKLKRLPVAFLLSLGLREITYLGSPAIRIPYFDAERGAEPVIRFRIALHGADRFRWRRGSKPRLYGLEQLAEARKVGAVTLVEGESDTHTLLYGGFPALGLPGAGNWDETRDAPLLDGIATIYLFVEPDQGGKTALGWLSRSRIRERVRLIRLDGFKDASAFYLDDPERFSERWRAAVDAAEHFNAIADREAAAQTEEAKGAAGDLMLEPHILERFAADLERSGLVGEAKNGKLLFLALTTRLFERPVSIAIKGPSSGGKSFMVETVLRFFPRTAYFERTAMSDRALAYSDEDFRHRHLVIYEAAGMSSDIASYLIRSLLSEGRIRYELVERTKNGLRPRLIEKLGPTGLIVTTTATKLHPENETRLVSLAIKDTQQQTAAIMRALARDGEIGTAVDYTKWQAYQKWVAAGERSVTVPFASQLADLIPPIAVRLRRDFNLLLLLIRAHALLHRERRGRDDRDRIVATFGDYAAVRELVSDLFAEGIEATVKLETQETVAVVKTLGKDEVSISEIAKALKLDKGTASRRVADAISHSYLVNNEIRKGRPARISTGDAMPDEIEILPHHDKLADCCSVELLNEEICAPPSLPGNSETAAELAEIEI